MDVSDLQRMASTHPGAPEDLQGVLEWVQAFLQHGLRGNRAIGTSSWSVVRALGRAYTLRLQQGITEAQAAAGPADDRALELWIIKAAASGDLSEALLQLPSQPHILAAYDSSAQLRDPGVVHQVVSTLQALEARFQATPAPQAPPAAGAPPAGAAPAGVPPVASSSSSSSSPGDPTSSSPAAEVGTSSGGIETEVDAIQQRTALQQAPARPGWLPRFGRTAAAAAEPPTLAASAPPAAVLVDSLTMRPLAACPDVPPEAATSGDSGDTGTTGPSVSFLPQVVVDVTAATADSALFAAAIDSALSDPAILPSSETVGGTPAQPSSSAAAPAAGAAAAAAAMAAFSAVHSYALAYAPQSVSSLGALAAKMPLQWPLGGRRANAGGRGAGLTTPPDAYPAAAAVGGTHSSGVSATSGGGVGTAVLGGGLSPSLPCAEGAAAAAMTAAAAVAEGAGCAAGGGPVFSTQTSSNTLSTEGRPLSSGPAGSSRSAAPLPAAAAASAASAPSAAATPAVLVSLQVVKQPSEDGRLLCVLLHTKVAGSASGGGTPTTSTAALGTWMYGSAVEAVRQLSDTSGWYNRLPAWPQAATRAPPAPLPPPAQPSPGASPSPAGADEDDDEAHLFLEDMRQVLTGGDAYHHLRRGGSGDADRDAAAAAPAAAPQARPSTMSGGVGDGAATGAVASGAARSSGGGDPPLTACGRCAGLSAGGGAHGMECGAAAALSPGEAGVNGGQAATSDGGTGHVLGSVRVASTSTALDTHGTQFTAYLLSGARTWQASRRFSEVQALCSDLRPLCPAGLPASWDDLGRARTLLGGARMAAETVQARRALLERCLSDLVAAGAPLTTSQPFLRFIGAPDGAAAAPAAVAAVSTAPAAAAASSIATVVLLETGAAKPPSPAGAAAATAAATASSTVSKDSAKEPVSAARVGLAANNGGPGGGVGMTVRLQVEAPPVRSDAQQYELQAGGCTCCQAQLAALPLLNVRPSAAGRAGAPRKCHYTGRLFCGDCHGGNSAVLPWRVLHHWDFAPLPVCHAVHEFLGSASHQPLLSVTAVAPALYARVPLLSTLRGLRQAVRHHLAQASARGAGELARVALLRDAAGPRAYLLEGQADFWSLHDLGDVARGAKSTLSPWLADMAKQAAVLAAEPHSVATQAQAP